MVYSAVVGYRESFEKKKKTTNILVSKRPARPGQPGLTSGKRFLSLPISWTESKEFDRL